MLPSASTEAARTPDVPTSTTRMLTGPDSRPAQLAEGRGEAELAGIEDAAGIEGLLHRGQNVEGGTERWCHEGRPVDPDAVVVADGPAVGDHAVHDPLPGRPVV